MDPRRIPPSAASDPLDFLASLSDKIDGFFYRCLNDADYTMLRLTSGFDRLTGFSSADLVLNKRSFSSLVHPDDLPILVGIVDRGIELNERWRITYRLRTTRGTYIRCGETGGAVLDPLTGEVIYLDGVVMDLDRMV